MSWSLQSSSGLKGLPSVVIHRAKTSVRLTLDAQGGTCVCLEDSGTKMPPQREILHPVCQHTLLLNDYSHFQSKQSGVPHLTASVQSWVYPTPFLADAVAFQSRTEFTMHVLISAVTDIHASRPLCLAHSWVTALLIGGRFDPLVFTSFST